MAGGAHAVRFETGTSEPSYVTSVRIHGSRYGRARAPEEDFHIWLCDEDFRQFAEFKIPYSVFERGSEKWVTLEVQPTKVPSKFIVCVGFNPTATKGVYVSHDGRRSGNSISGLPGQPPRDFDAGDWMIRVNLQQNNHDFALKPGDAATSFRTWTDATGQFTVQAEFVRVKDGNVVLRKANGIEIKVPLEKLSQADQEFVRHK